MYFFLPIEKVDKERAQFPSGKLSSCQDTLLDAVCDAWIMYRGEISIRETRRFGYAFDNCRGKIFADVEPDPVSESVTKHIEVFEVDHCVEIFTQRSGCSCVDLT